MQLPLILIKGFLNRELYQRYWTKAKLLQLSAEDNQLFRLSQCVQSLHADPERISIPAFSIAELELELFKRYPNSKPDEYRLLFESLLGLSFDERSLGRYLTELENKTRAKEIALRSIAVSEGREDFEVFRRDLLSKLTESNKGSNEQGNEEFLNDNITQLHDSVFTSGLRWRLQSLNRSLGSLRKGDFGFVFARPESGKTTFLASEVTYFAEQIKDGQGPILWFNNEEQSEKVLIRCYQAALGVEVHGLYSNIESSKTQYNNLCHNQIKFPLLESCNKQDIERLCKAYSPSLIIFDQIDKLQGFSGDRNDLELGSIYQWARTLARSYCPIIGVSQAGSTGEGKKWLTMNDVDNSKTSKQAEADWILGIGKSLDESYMYERYFHLSKNKLFGDKDSDSNLRHNKWAVQIKPEIARYEDFRN